MIEIPVSFSVWLPSLNSPLWAVYFIIGGLHVLARSIMVLNFFGSKMIELAELRVYAVWCFLWPLHIRKTMWAYRYAHKVRRKS